MRIDTEPRKGETIVTPVANGTEMQLRIFHPEFSEFVCDSLWGAGIERPRGELIGMLTKAMVDAHAESEEDMRDYVCRYLEARGVCSYSTASEALTIAIVEMEGIRDALRDLEDRGIAASWIAEGERWYVLVREGKDAGDALIEEGEGENAKRAASVLVHMNVQRTAALHARSLMHIRAMSEILAALFDPHEIRTAGEYMNAIMCELIKHRNRQEAEASA